MSTTTPPRIKKIVLTGGPCAGKTSAMPPIVERFSALGWKVCVIPEAATLLINGGLKPWDMIPDAYLKFQRSMMAIQVSLEDTFVTQALASGKDTLIICDRGIFDGAAYCDPVIWDSVLAGNGMTEIEARDKRYDAVIHMVTAAKGAPQYYTRLNNAARSESPEQAIAADTRTLNAWIGHPHLRVAENRAGFEAKITQVLKEISDVLGSPVPIEAERKFRVALRPGVALPRHETFTVIQHYLPDEGDRETRIRRRGRGGNWLFTLTIKEPTPDRKNGRFERERLLADSSYLDLLASHPKAPYVQKERTVFVHDGRYFEMDRFVSPQLEDLILEVETDDTGPINFPDFLEILGEVTSDDRYSNRRLAVTG